LRDNVCMKVSASRRHGHSYGYKVGCELCRTEAAQAKRELRARKRGLTAVPSAPVAAPVPAEAVGPVVAAVRRDLDGLGDLTGWQYLAAAAIQMGRILDSGGNVPTQPAAAEQLASLMDTLHREAAPRRGRLAAVQAMSKPSRPDAG
jgi:hypothetical protein